MLKQFPGHNAGFLLSERREVLEQRGESYLHGCPRLGSFMLFLVSAGISLTPSHQDRTSSCRLGTGSTVSALSVQGTQLSRGGQTHKQLQAKVAVFFRGSNQFSSASSWRRVMACHFDSRYVPPMSVKALLETSSLPTGFPLARIASCACPSSSCKRV